MTAIFTHAMVLAAGLGNRMRPLTQTRPKPLIEVAGKTLLDYNLDHLAHAGVTRAAVNIHYLGQQVIDHLATRTAPEIIISDERAGLLDSGGGVKKALPTLGADPFFCLNADTIWIDGPQSNLQRMAQAFDPAQMDVLLLVAPTVTTIGWGNRGDFALSQDGRLSRPKAGEVAPYAYTGVAILKPDSFVGMPDIFSLNRIFDAAAAQGRLHGLRLDGVFMHVGTPQARDEAEEAMTATMVR